MSCAARCDDSKTRSEFGLEPRPLRETLADTVRWLVEVGHLSPAERAGSRMRPSEISGAADAARSDSDERAACP
jgi:hypothetical protein